MPLRLLATASRLADAPDAEVVVFHLDRPHLPGCQAHNARTPHPEVRREAKPRRTHDGGASFEADLRPGPRHEEGGESRRSLFQTRSSGPARYLRIGELDDSPDLKTAAGLDGILLGDTRGPIDIERLGARIAVAEADAGIADGTLRILPLIGTPRGVLSLSSFEPLPRLAGIACDPDRLAAALGCAADAPAIVQARASTVLAAGACGVPAILVIRTLDEAVELEGFTAVFLDDRL